MHISHTAHTYLCKFRDKEVHVRRICLWLLAYPIYIIHNLNCAHRSCIEAKHTDGAMLGCKHRWHHND